MNDLILERPYVIFYLEPYLKILYSAVGGKNAFFVITE